MIASPSRAPRRLAFWPILMSALMVSACGSAPRSNAPTGLAVAQARATGGHGPVLPAAYPDAAEVRRLFEFTDADHDGFLSYRELLEAPMGAPAGGWPPGEKERGVKAAIERLDVDHDGRLSFKEYKAGVAASSAPTGPSAP